MAAALLSGCGGSGDEPPATSSPGVISDSAVSSLSPVPRIFDEAALEAGVRRVLVQSYGLTDVGTVHCPTGQSVQTGVSFDCEVQTGRVTRHVTLTVRGPDGTYEVSQPK
ncbi:MAG TPA: DUF4333 domain-containing protein [Amycolatopsis sp.]|nr:DUF4333 domain-containing protein [Amycolatopsis sp.]